MKVKIKEDEFNKLKDEAYSKIIRDSYLFFDDDRISIKKYLEKYDGLIRGKVCFKSVLEMNSYIKESWRGKEFTTSSLAFDKNLSMLTEKEFLLELNEYI